MKERPLHRCKNCKNWNHNTIASHSKRFGFCEKMEKNPNYFDKAKMIDPSRGFWGHDHPQTRDDFGCILWEKKEAQASKETE